MDRLAAAADRLECTDLVTRLARAIDRCDASALAALFTADATDDHGMFKGSATDFIAWVMPVLATMKRTQHVIGQVLIELHGPDAAAGEAYFIAHHTIDTDGGEILMIAAGRYLDRFERVGGAWKIAHRHAVYDWSSTMPSTDAWDRAAMVTHSFGVRGTGDASYAHLAMG